MGKAAIHFQRATTIPAGCTNRTCKTPCANHTRYQTRLRTYRGVVCRSPGIFAGHTTFSVAQHGQRKTTAVVVFRPTLYLHPRVCPQRAGLPALTSFHLGKQQRLLAATALQQRNSPVKVDECEGSGIRLQLRRVLSVLAGRPGGALLEVLVRVEQSDLVATVEEATVPAHELDVVVDPGSVCAHVLHVYLTRIGLGSNAPLSFNNEATLTYPYINKKMATGKNTFMRRKERRRQGWGGGGGCHD